MARINLLDWREEQRQERQKEFLITLGLMVVLAGIIIFLVHTVMATKISDQQEKNAFLETELRQIDRQIKEIEELEAQREQLIMRMDLIQELQQSRPEVVRLFDEMVRVVPEGIHLQKLERLDTALKLEGQAETNPRISELMRKANASDRLKTGELKKVERAAKGVPAQNFILNMNQVVPADAMSKDSEGGQ